MTGPYRLRDHNDREFESPEPGTLGGHKGSKIYDRLDCPAALGAIARGHYVAHRVFFADRETSERAGYRPCGRCMKEAYRAWKAARG